MKGLRAVRLSVKAAVADISCRWPRGRIDEACAQELCAVAEDLRTDADIRVVVLRSDGPHFCLGVAGSDSEARRRPAGSGWHLPAALDCVAALAAIPAPVLAVVTGNAWAEGCELALACDLRLASTGATFRLPQIVEGRLPVHGATQRLPRLIGAARALDLLWSGRTVSAAEAERIGLATRVVAASRLGALVAQTVAELASRGPAALRLAKEAVRAAADLTLDQGIRLEQDLYVLLQTTDDRREGIDAFREKRQPRFRGR